MRISDWSSDVCSSDLRNGDRLTVGRNRIELGLSIAVIDRDESGLARGGIKRLGRHFFSRHLAVLVTIRRRRPLLSKNPTSFIPSDLKSVVEGTRVSVRVILGGRRLLKKKNKNQ